MAIKKRIPAWDLVCPLCNLHDETVEYLLLLCDFSRAVWMASPVCHKFESKPNSLLDWVLFSQGLSILLRRYFPNIYHLLAHLETTI